MMMADREKVIKSLKDCLANQGCGYMDGVGELYAVSGEDLQNAIAMLKEQEPRVMTLEEVKGMKRLTVCAVEQRSKVNKYTFNAEYGGIVTLGDKNLLDFGLYGNTNRYRRTEAGYGQTWRCWSAKPTDEQRQEVKWDE